MGTEPFKPPHAKMSSHVPGPDLRARHPAFQDPDQGSKPKQAAKLAAEPASIASDQQPVDMEAG